ncbi:hypothetical protein LI328DRAFT_128322 [Trichoderma asperelloides]|nr:hypothetical protein LI328DRAFT_128322 [Trichoderma asperelloides]
MQLAVQLGVLLLARPSDADTGLPGVFVARNLGCNNFFFFVCVIVVSHWPVVPEAGDFGDAGCCRMIGARKREAGTTERKS